MTGGPHISKAGEWVVVVFSLILAYGLYLIGRAWGWWA